MITCRTEQINNLMWEQMQSDSDSNNIFEGWTFTLVIFVSTNCAVRNACQFSHSLFSNLFLFHKKGQHSTEIKWGFLSTTRYDIPKHFFRNRINRCNLFGVSYPLTFVFFSGMI